MLQVKSTFSIKLAPKQPQLATLGLGQPQFKLISSYPAFSTNIAAFFKFKGLEPPICNTIGCSFS